MMLKHLLSPISINKLLIKNRIVRAAHGTNYGHGEISEEMIAYHAARARAGVGLSILEATVVHPSSVTHTVDAHTDDIIAGFQRLARMSESHGMATFVQLWHGGHRWGPLDGRAGLSPSSVPCPLGTVNVPFAMSQAQIAEISDAFVSAAVRVKQGGLHGVEVHFGHGYLIHQFLCGLTNKRDDEYGGSFENRSRFGRQIMESIRAALGPDFPIGIRISDYDVPGGFSMEEAAEVVDDLQKAKLIDYVDVSKGSHYNYASMVSTMDEPAGYQLPSAAVITSRATVPAMVSGRFRTLEEADQVIRDGTADMVSLVRAMIADPALITKTLAGHSERVRPCIACNQGCIAGFRIPPHRMLCTVNPVVGHELEIDEDHATPSSNPQKLVVIGGGPAGMEAARVAALAGHSVVLFEAQSSLGGAVNIAARAPKAATIGDLTYWLEQEIYRLGVDVRLSSFADAEDVLAEEPDAIIVATGSLPRMDGVQAARADEAIAGHDLPHVLSSHGVFAISSDRLGRSAVVLDDVGHYEAIAAAEYLISQGLSVSFVTRHSAFAPLMEFSARAEPALRRLRKGKFRLHVRSRLVAIGQGFCQIGHLDGDETWTEPADTVVLVTYNEPLNDVYRALGRADVAKTHGFTLQLIGDANSPRDLLVAMREGNAAARSMET